MIGVKFNRWLVIAAAEPYIAPNGNTMRRWICLCDCGCFGRIRQDHLKSGNSSSCGCFSKELKTIHGKSKTKSYTVWENMLSRCNNANHPCYNHYGGRGIKVCDRWLESFENFHEDMGDAPEGMSIDRIDVDKDYYLENCRWTTQGDQVYNQRVRSDNTSGKPGVYWNKTNSNWYARIYIKGVQINLGVFDNFEDAVNAREIAELRYYGKLKN